MSDLATNAHPSMPIFASPAQIVTCCQRRADGIPHRTPKMTLYQSQLTSAQWPPEGCGLAPFDTSLPGLPLFDGPNPLGAIRSSNSSTSSSFTSSWSFILFHHLSVLE